MHSHKPRQIGDKHTIKVVQALHEYLQRGLIPDKSSISGATALYIIDKQPTFESVISKFEYERPDQHSDLTLVKPGGETVLVNLYKIKNNQQIQPKNLGAKSFIKKYFGSLDLQTEFNKHFEDVYRDYLEDIINTVDVRSDPLMSIGGLKKIVRCNYSKFEKNIDKYRSRLLYELREKCFFLFLKEYNSNSGSIESAFNTLFMTDSFNVVTRYQDDELLRVEEFLVKIGSIKKVSISKVGMNSLGITSDKITLLLRFKFESNPTSSIKLATSFAKSSDKDTTVSENRNSLSLFKNAISNRMLIDIKSRDSNAIGKCAEAIFYFQFLSDNDAIRQVDKNNFINMFNTYAKNVPNKDLDDILLSVVQATKKLANFIIDKYGSHTIESIELVPENYLKNRLDTADLELLLNVSGKYIIEPISLKAMAKNMGEIICKNPGVGKIMSSTYFNLDQRHLSSLVDEAKKDFKDNKLDHRGALEFISDKIAYQLVNAPQSNLVKGLKAMLGEALVIVLFYNRNQSLIFEHDEHISNVTVHRNTPSLIQNGLSWRNEDHLVSMRVKFSKGQSYGWSSLKLACSYSIRVC